MKRDFLNISLKYLIFLLLTNCSSNETKKNSLELLSLKGKIKSIELKSFSAIEKFGKIEKINKSFEYPWFVEYHDVFNENGYLIEKKRFYENENLNNKTIIEYDENFKIVKENHYNQEGLFSGKTTWKYDKYGNNIENINYDNYGNFKGKFVTVFDKNNQVVEETYFDSEKTILTKSIYEYDSNNHLVKKTDYYKNKFDEKRIFEYNKKNELIATKILDSSEVLIYKRINHYSDEGEGLLNEIVDYDNKGLIIRKEKFVFDEKYNWIEKIIYDGKKAKFLISRKIEYYE